MDLIRTIEASMLSRISDKVFSGESNIITSFISRLSTEDNIAYNIN